MAMGRKIVETSQTIANAEDCSNGGNNSNQADSRGSEWWRRNWIRRGGGELRTLWNRLDGPVEKKKTKVDQASTHGRKIRLLQALEIKKVQIYLDKFLFTV